MPRPGCAWWHLILTGRCSWLPGDPRGFRSRDHRIHSSGDYRNPPPSGEHANLHRYAQNHSGPERTFPPDIRRRLGEAMLATIRKAGLRVLVVAVGHSHGHVLVECSDNLAVAKRLQTRLKQVSSLAVRDAMPGRIWASGGKPIRIADRGASGAGAWVYSGPCAEGGGVDVALEARGWVGGGGGYSADVT